ncbi:hypothetical protein KC238_08185 [Mycobacteroides chelonae]|uniref:hypothetical protein n=1 Tax=Mycobacteroides TaxID=670516 RepID=UPI000C259E71|nr:MULTISPECIES: hypothetical protein [Mycobacteroides]MBV0917234.1 hypothetical protein [Mycobacteroides chelonae]RIR09473.1 hypothetical protein D2E27_19785 [Mycobacteroides abscessus]
MTIKRIGAVTVVAVGVAFPLAACGSSTPPAPVATTSIKPLSPDFRKSYCGINSSTRTACEQQDALVEQQQYAAAHPKPKDDGLPWWAWLLIVPAALVALAVLGFKLSELNDERRVAKAWAKVDELDARAARRATRFGDDDYEEDEDDEDDELDEADMAFLHRVTDSAPAPVHPAPPAAGGSLLSSLRNQGGAQ